MPARLHTFGLELVVCDLVGLPLDGLEDVGGSSAMVWVEWSGGGGGGGRRSVIARRAVDRDHTALQRVRPDGGVGWWERFRRECKLKMVDPQKGFNSWIVKLEIHGFGAISKDSSSILAKTQLDLSIFASPGKEIIVVPVECRIRGFGAEAELRVILEFSDPRIKRGALSTIARALSFRGFSSSAFSQTDSGHDWRPRTRAEDAKFSVDESARSPAVGLPSDEATEPNNGRVVAGGFRLFKGFGSRREDGKNKKMEKRPQETHHFPHQVSRTHSLGRFMRWNRGQHGSRSTRYPNDGPLLYETSGEGAIDGVVDDRRAQPSAAAASSPSTQGVEEERRVLGFEEEGQFEIGSWEERTVASRDGRLELVTEVFLASIDQRSEKAAGESACSVLAAVIADWLHRNPRALPLRCEFDRLVREGSSEWRRLCADESRMERFSDSHFDLDTVLGAKVRPLTVVTGLSYVGFFDLEAAPEYLRGAMSFEDVWQELLCAEAWEERVYIAGWNDHFFVLKVEKEAVYLVDTLGERLLEGCDQAYILKFDKHSKVYEVTEDDPTSMRAEQQQDRCISTSGSPVRGEEVGAGGNDKADVGSSSSSRRMLCEGLAAGREFIKGFLAALPLRELRDDMERGRVEESYLHRLLQIEFHYTFPL